MIYFKNTPWGLNGGPITLVCICTKELETIAPKKMTIVYVSHHYERDKNKRQILIFYTKFCIVPGAWAIYRTLGLRPRYDTGPMPLWRIQAGLADTRDDTILAMV